MVLDTRADAYIEDAFEVIKNGRKILTILGFTDDYVEKTSNSTDKNSEFQQRISKQIELESDYEFPCL